MAPLAYVVPTADMEIKTGRHVDAEGRVYLPYLTEWKHVRLKYVSSYYLYSISSYQSG